jgi:hypothetical protein
MWWGAREQGCAAGDVAEGWHAEVDGGGPAGPLVELGEFLFRAGEADFEALDLAEPAFAFGLGDADQQAFADLGDPAPLGWIGSKEAAPQAAVLTGAPSVCR